MDLVGFTALTAERGDDGAADVAIRFYDRVRSLLPTHGAEEIKTIGDAMMVHCHDPALGIHLGLRIVEELDGDSAFPPLRVGVHTGTAVNRHGDWYGGAVNVAARLCSAAGGGEVLVSETTGDAAGCLPSVELGERRLHWLKNVAEPVAARPAYKLQAPQPRARLSKLRKLIPRPGDRLALEHSEVTG
jgi:class 3 adenylate cyclase